MTDMERIRAALTLNPEDEALKEMTIARHHNSSPEEKSQRVIEETNFLNNLKAILKHMTMGEAEDYLVEKNIINSLVSKEGIQQMLDITIDLDRYVQNTAGGRKRKRSTKRKKRRGKNTRKYRRKY